MLNLCLKKYLKFYLSTSLLGNKSIIIYLTKRAKGAFGIINFTVFLKYRISFKARVVRSTRLFADIFG